MKQLADYPTVALDDAASEILMLDQTLLPGELKLLRLSKQEDIWEAINVLRVRGAPAIGVTAAYALYLAAKACPEEDPAAFEAAVQKAADYLATSRPTAVNLFWALDRMTRAAKGNRGRSVQELKALLHEEAVAINDENTQMCLAIGEHGLTLLKPGMGLLTHCNAGRLGTVEYGTVTAPMYLGHERGYGFRVFCDETRPLLQGARLTAFELSAAGLDATVLCDNMSSALMQTGQVDAVLVGCDRVAANGDTANKIGTSLLAIAANHYGVPVYVLGPTSTIDVKTPTGKEIPIEQRPGEEVTELWYEKRMAPEGVGVFNPAFDVTPAGLISGIVTERGVLRPPYTESIAALGL
ncbi:MAG: S-methyl-5-thioribose-1-phosphate isomerase [Clostridiales Family XIII bacterium]|jgi:methylthioribose-1-phosphate isomerase|nr:S-methyl-5-thioribose-1-phosphate isomerase [Clostridiales Family XIII bacterium]